MSWGLGVPVEAPRAGDEVPRLRPRTGPQRCLLPGWWACGSCRREGRRQGKSQQLTSQQSCLWKPEAGERVIGLQPVPNPRPAALAEQHFHIIE